MGENETPSEREQRLDEMKIGTELDSALKKGRIRVLKEQPPKVQKLMHLRDWAEAQAQAVGMVGLAVDTEDWLPATTEAWEAAISAMERLSTELAAEIASEWAD